MYIISFKGFYHYFLSSGSSDRRCFPGVKLFANCRPPVSGLRQLVAQIADYLTPGYQIVRKIKFIMGESSDVYSSAFEERVKKTVCVCDLSPHATDEVLKAALGQFGDVVKVEFNYFHPELPRAALVEMSTVSEAQKIISDLEKTPFMITGMPRPVKVIAAEPRMFDNRSRKSGKRSTLCWLRSDDPRFDEAKKIKSVVKRQEAEANLLVQRQLVEAEKMAAIYKMFQLVEGVFADGSVHRLRQLYKMDLNDDDA